MKARSPVGFTK